jgi:hypothetical protein
VHVDGMALVLPLLRQPAARHSSRSFASVVAILPLPHDVVVLLRIGKNLGRITAVSLQPRTWIVLLPSLQIIYSEPEITFFTTSPHDVR